MHWFMLTLFGMILAIGLVVDDAIVVVENTERNMVQFGLSPKDAAKRAMDEVSGPVIAVVLVLSAVFVPVAFLGGITGALYKQFAVAIAISVVFSGIIALTVFAIVVSGSVWLFRTLPTAFVPQEDQGYVFVAYFLPDAASLSRTGEVGDRAAAAIGSHPAVAKVSQVDGYSLIDSQMKTNFGVLFVALKDYEERKSPDLSANAVIEAGRREALCRPSSNSSRRS